jgi:acetolactate decarboxylase
MLDPALAAAARGHVVQYETLADLTTGHYSATTTVGAAFGGCVVGLGVAEAADGELLALDGATWRIPADGQARQAPADLGVAFAVAARGGRAVTLTASGSLDDVSEAVAAAMGPLAIADHLVAAVRIDGTFRDVLLRSEPRQEPPYRPLAEVLDHEIRFAFDEWSGSLAGFRFPDDASGATVPGLHLHAISHDRRTGGHCHRARVLEGTVTVWVDDVEILVPSSPTTAA